MRFTEADHNIKNLLGKNWEEIKHLRRSWEGSYPLIDRNNMVFDIVNLDGKGILGSYRKNSEIFYYDENNCYYLVEQ